MVTAVILTSAVFKDTAVQGHSIARVVVQVDYSPGAVPCVGIIPPLRNNAWGIFSTNVRRVFRGSGVQFTIPTTLGEMGPIETPLTDYTVNDLMRLSQRNRRSHLSATTATFHVMILDGYLRDSSGQRRTDLLAGSIHGTGIIAIFRPVVMRTETVGSPYVVAITEQIALVHELGHAVGLVNNGTSSFHRHEDRAYPHHCASNFCVMNAWNEGATGASLLIARFASTGDLVLFDDDCLADIDNASIVMR